MQALSESLGMARRVTWAGLQSDMTAVYSALDVLTSSPFFGQGIPNVICEAMACGVPCAVTDVGDSGRIVGDLGEVAPPRDPVALAEAISRLLDRLEQAPNLRQRVRSRVETEFSLALMVARSEQILFGQR